MNVFIAGASGFVGTHVVPGLLAGGHQLTALVHSESSRREMRPRHPEVHLAIGDVSRLAELGSVVPNDTDAIVYLPGLIREFPNKGVTFEGVHVEGVRVLLDQAKRVGVRRWIEMSALGARPDPNIKYFSTKWQAEQLVKASGLDWTILRPSMIFGDEPSHRKNFVGELSDALRKAPFLPIFGDGNYRLQPISSKDVAATVVQSLANSATIGKIYEMGGPKQLRYEEIIRAIAHALDLKKPVLHIPFGLIEPIARLFDRWQMFPVTYEQLLMLKAENIVRDPGEDEIFRRSFTLPLLDFELSLPSFFHKPLIL